MLWHGERQGQGVGLSGERSVAGRHAKKAWGVQLADQWMSKDVHTIALLLEQVTENCYIGVVGRNYFPSAWDAPLKESTHATVVHAADGRVFTKRSSTSFFLKPLESGARLQLTIDMSSREITYELFDPGDPSRVLSSLSVEGIPAECALAVCFGPGGEQRVKIVGTSIEKAVDDRGKMVKDLWDEENVVPPLKVNERSFGGQDGLTHGERLLRRARRDSERRRAPHRRSRRLRLERLRLALRAQRRAAAHAAREIRPPLAPRRLRARAMDGERQRRRRVAGSSAHLLAIRFGPARAAPADHDANERRREHTDHQRRRAHQPPLPSDHRLRGRRRGAPRRRRRLHGRRRGRVGRRRRGGRRGHRRRHRY